MIILVWFKTLKVLQFIQKNCNLINLFLNSLNFQRVLLYTRHLKVITFEGCSIDFDDLHFLQNSTFNLQTIKFIDCRDIRSKLVKGYSFKISGKIIELIYSTRLIKTIKTIELEGNFIQEEELRTIAEKFELQIRIKISNISGTVIFSFPS